MEIITGVMTVGLCLVMFNIMKIKDIYNSIGERVGNLGDSLSNVFSSKTTYNANDYKKNQQPTGQMAPQVIQTPQTYNLKNRGVTVTDDDIESFRPLLYGEVSNRNPDKKQLEADVIFNTALNRQREYASLGQNKTLSEILSMPNQYQAYNGEQYKEYANPILPMSIEKKKEIDAIVDDIKARVKSGEFEDNTEGAYYYIHNSDGSITYDNLKELFAK